MANDVPSTAIVVEAIANAAIQALKETPRVTRRHASAARSTCGQSFLFQTYPLINPPDLDPEVRRRRILALAHRLQFEGSRYTIWPVNWWKLDRIYQAREHYASLVDFSLMYDIMLPEISW